MDHSITIDILRYFIGDILTDCDVRRSPISRTSKKRLLTSCLAIMKHRYFVCIYYPWALTLPLPASTFKDSAASFESIGSVCDTFQLLRLNKCFSVKDQDI